MKVLKFGGTSVGNAKRIKNIANIISDQEYKIIIFSAFEGITNLLSEFFKQSFNQNWIISEQLLDIISEQHAKIIDELFSSHNFKEIALKKLKETIQILSNYKVKRIKEKDEKSILSKGEILSSLIIYLYLLEKGLDVALIHSLEFLKMNKFNEPDYSFIEQNLSNHIEKHKGCKLFITQGFICVNHKNRIDNLGHSGSDYTATIIGNALNAESIEIWTDINGLQNNDPRFVKKTQCITHLSYDEASELAYFGAKILHPASITPALNKSIPIKLKNSMNPDHEGTIISASGKIKLKAVAAKDHITTIYVRSARMMQAYGFLSKIFEVFEKYHTSVDMLTTSEISVAMTIENTSHLTKISEDLSAFGEVTIEKDQCIICIVGNNSNKQNTSMLNIIEGLNHIPIKMISYGASRNNITLVVDSSNKTLALNLLNIYTLSNEPCLTTQL